MKGPSIGAQGPSGDAGLGRVARIALIGSILGALVVVGVVSGPRPAAAHAELATSSPGDGAGLERSPKRISLTFTEDVSMGLDGIRVLDREGSRVDEGSATATGRRASVGVEDDLPDGAYVVAWRAISADSHPIDGAFTFTVGEGASGLDPSTVEGLVGGGDGSSWRAAGDIARFVGYSGALLAIGLAVFLVSAFDSGSERRLLRRLLRVAAVVGAVGLLAELPARAALATGGGASSITEDGVIGRLLGDNVGIGLVAVLVALLVVALTGARNRASAGLGLVALSVGLAIAGHTAATSPLVVAVGSDAVHVAAAAVWFGGLAGALVVLLSRHRAGESAALVLVRFSVVGGYALVGVAVGGAVLAWTQVRSVDALMTTSYGQLLLAKVATVTVVALIGGWNRYRLIPVLEHDLAQAGEPAGATGGDAPEHPGGRTDPTEDAENAECAEDATRGGPEADEPASDGGDRTATTTASRPLGAAALRQLRVTVTSEVVLLIAVLAMTAVLVGVTPARTAVAVPFSGSAPLGTGRAELTVDPTRAGRTDMHMFLYDQNGDPLDAPEGVVVRMSLPAADITGIEEQPLSGGPGHWTLTTDSLSVPGTWRIEIVAGTSRFDQEVATFDVPISS